jgi:DNA-directed RNA polymerase subunit beta
MEEIRDFSKTKSTFPVPNLLHIQKTSYKDFLERGIGKILSKIFPVDTKNIKVEYVNYSVDNPVRPIEDCLRVGATYEARVNARFRMIFKNTGEIKEQDVYIADVPLMLPDSSFLINGRKRVVVQQLIRSPGIFFQTSKDSETGVTNYLVTIIPDRGNWMEIEVGRDNVMYIRLKKKMRKIPMTAVLKAVGFSGNDEILSTFVRPMTIEILTTSPFSYEIALGKELVENISTSDGKIIAKAGSVFTDEILAKLLKHDIEKTFVKVKGIDFWVEQTLKKDRTNNPNEARIEIYKLFHPRERVTIEAAEELVNGLLNDPQKNEYFPVSRYKINKKFEKSSTSKILTKEDYIDIVSYLLGIREGITKEDDIDSLSNRRIRTIGELVAEEFERGAAKVHRNAKDRISITKPEEIKLTEIISAKTISGQLRQFFGASQLSQFMEETNPLSSITHKRRLSSLGAGGLHRKRAGIEVRDVHYSHYSRICPIETPEGQNIGLINSLTTYAGINKYGFITALYRKVNKGVVTNKIVELTADEEEKYIIAQANTPVDEKRRIISDFVIARERSESGEILPRAVPREKVQLMDIVPQQVISASAALIPFLEHDDANRALMGCNMQRQAVPLLAPDLSRVSTGMERRIALDDVDLSLAEEDGIVSNVSGSEVHIVPDNAEEEEVSVYREAKDLKSNLLNRSKQKEIILFEFKPDIEDYSKFTGERLTPSIIDKLISKGIEQISIIEQDKIQRFPVINCFETEKNELVINFIAQETIVSKKNKPIIEQGQKISDTKLNRLFSSGIKEIKVEEDSRIIMKPVFYLTLTSLGKNIIGKGLYGTLINTKKTMQFVNSITENLLVELYDKGVTDLLVYSPVEIEKFFLGKINLDIADRVVAENYYSMSGKKDIIVKKGELLNVEKLHNLAGNGITRIKVKKEEIYSVRKFQRTNQDTCRNERPIVTKGQKIKKGEPIVEGYSTKQGELALGINALVAYVSWYGFNYQDAMIVSRRLVSEDRLTSVHIKEYTVEQHETEQGPEELTIDPPDVSKEAKRFLDESGIVKIGSKVKPGDLLVGKITPFPEEEETNEAKLFRALFNNRPGNIKNSSFRVPPGEGGTVVDVQVFSREEGYELAKTAIKLIKIFIAKKRKIIVGDKLAGRHGNKGVISKIVPEEDLPYLEDGTTIDVILSPLSVPSRMNLGQILEANIGLAARKLNLRVITPSFNGASEKEVRGLLKEAGLNDSGQFVLYDGRTGKSFNYKVTVGEFYILKLNHLAEDKIHARSVGKYTLITQQPVGGKAQFGGQRLGEMEVWALEAYGAASLLQEMLTIKSDDLEGRKRAYEEIAKGNTMFETGVPESFNVLQRSLRGLALDLKVLPEEKAEKPKKIPIITSKNVSVTLNSNKDKEEVNEG